MLLNKRNTGPRTIRPSGFVCGCFCFPSRVDRDLTAGLARGTAEPSKRGNKLIFSE